MGKGALAIYIMSCNKIDELCNRNSTKPSTNAPYTHDRNHLFNNNNLSTTLNVRGTVPCYKYGHWIRPNTSRYSRPITRHNPVAVFPSYQTALQNNSSRMMPSSFSMQYFPPNQTIAPNSLQYNAPHSFIQNIPSTALIPSLSYLAPNEECAICMISLRSTGHVMSLKICNHFFHKSCIEESLKKKPQCPICRKALSEPQGKSPSGSMTVSSTSSQCSGYHIGSIVIDYHMLNGTQKSYHDNPGFTHGSKQERAYLPDNKDGQELLKRLKYAFMRGLTFTVGTSVTTGIANQCTWSSIHHKTSQSGGVSSHGFPDPLYFINCNEELDGLGVPKAHVLDDSGGLL